MYPVWRRKEGLVARQGTSYMFTALEVDHEETDSLCIERFNWASMCIVDCFMPPRPLVGRHLATWGFLPSFLERFNSEAEF